jgi:hypothetical protein
MSGRSTWQTASRYEFLVSLGWWVGQILQVTAGATGPAFVVPARARSVTDSHKTRATVCAQPHRPLAQAGLNKAEDESNGAAASSTAQVTIGELKERWGLADTRDAKGGTA